MTSVPRCSTLFPSISSTVVLGCFARHTATALSIGACPTMNIFVFRAKASRSYSTTAARPAGSVSRSAQVQPTGRNGHTAQPDLRAWRRPWRIKIVSSSPLLTPSPTCRTASVPNHSPSPPPLRVPEVQAG